MRPIELMSQREIADELHELLALQRRCALSLALTTRLIQLTMAFYSAHQGVR